jgi:addiction module RelE/StbE family toxin
MNIQYSSTFKKQYKKLPVKVQKQCDNRLTLFATEPNHPQLYHHPLSGSKKGYWSISMTGDIRALYRLIDGKIVLFSLLGTHSQLYG